MKYVRMLLAGLLAAALLTPCALAAPAPLTGLICETGTPGASVSLLKTEEGYTLFLPASADLTALTFRFDGGPLTLSAGGRSRTVASGQPFDLTALCPGLPADGVCALTLSRGSRRLSLSVMVSQNIASLYLTSDDPAHAGRYWVEETKGNKAAGQAVLLGPGGAVLYSGAVKQIKGRGNSTWDYPKKPYQIKLAEKADLLENGEAAKTWVLLANYYDESFLRNSMTYDLAAELGLAYSPGCRPVDLYYDGEYRGAYLLSEKTEVGEGRVEIHDLEGDFEAANPETADFDDLATAAGTNACGNSYQYVTGLNDPGDITGGYLLEIDFIDRAKTEKSYFTTSNGYAVVSKSPEYLSQTAMEYISGFYQEFEDAVFNGGVHPVTGRPYTDYADLDSLARCYLIFELSMNVDAYLSSTFFYKPAGEEKLYAGPVWDYDSAYGGTDLYDGAADDALPAGMTPLGRALLSIPSFCQAVEEIWREELLPLVTDVVLSPDAGAESGRLRSLAGYRAEVAASQRMNRVLWPGDAAAAADGLGAFLARRSQALSQVAWEGAAAGLSRFLDVSPDDWYGPAVEYVIDAGLFKGVSDILFQPQAAMTRAMAVTVLHRLAGAPETAETSSFPDVPRDQWYAGAVAWAEEAGIVLGRDDGRFHPDERLTRQELVTLLWRYARSAGQDVTAPEMPAAFSDRGQVADWAKDAFAWAMDRGILLGTGPTTCSPGGQALRCMAAAVFQRFDELLPA